MTFAVYAGPKGSGLVPAHAYAVVRVNVDESGAVVSLTLRNPWGVDGARDATDGRDDGYVTVSAAGAYAAMWGTTSAAC